jgi:predicted metalloprotease
VKRTSTSLIALGLVSMLAVACAQEASGSLTLTGGDGPSAPQVSDDPSAVAQRAVEDVTEFWRGTYPAVYGEEFQELAGFYPYGPNTETPPCGPIELAYEEIANNAFYCPDDDIIAWDEGQLMPQLNEEFGAFTVAIVIAHEYGHAAQARFGTADRTVDLELQADCFAGAWTQRVADGEAEGFEPSDVDLDKTVAGMISIRDAPGTEADDPMAHGSGFDRVSAFQDGFEHGAQKCAEYANETEDRLTAEIEFRDNDDYERGGNFPLEDGPEAPNGEGLLTLLERDLNDYYGQVATELGAEFTPVADLVIVDPSDAVSCGGDSLSGEELELAAIYCQDENVAVLDGNLVEQLNAEYGDFAVASEVAGVWAVAFQTQLGIDDGDAAGLQADCLTGSWAAWTFPVNGDALSDTLAMSAGDLDEGIMGFLAYRTEPEGGGSTVFERTAALRTGFFESYDACEEYGPLG